MKTVSATIKPKITVVRPDTALQWVAGSAGPAAPADPEG